jgi:hypothetical protein
MPAIRFNPAILANNPAAREPLLAILAAALAAVDPYAAVQAQMQRQDDRSEGRRENL